MFDFPHALPCLAIGFAYLKGGYYAFKFLKNDVKLFIETASLEAAWVKFLT
ncbi:hypothetical protein NEISUBOT_05142 [Neisseria subflava NJ9703]|uniref:Uncharacterized protein n=1 Tax=Neisseria subflava NJ9703 TaxID=546268 RepID=A0A9W5IPV1_NEISU|nr:hypothetical protein NEISUBOT_05142 [Neisseria subflava NJ9703]